MRKQIAAANWKMNLTAQQGEQLINDLLSKPHDLKENQIAIFAVPAPYLMMVQEKLGSKNRVAVAAQNCYSKKSGAFTGEISVEMLNSIGVKYVVLGHSERREYFNESNQFLAEKIDICLSNQTHTYFVVEKHCRLKKKATKKFM